MASTILKKDSVVPAADSLQKPLKFRQLWDMNFGYLGIQFGWGLQMANMAAIYSKLGAHPDKIPILTLAGPITGLVIQPIIGAMSDRTWHPRFGRRRPFFTIGAIVASIVLFFMPQSATLWVAASLLWLLDASINVSMEPFRAFVADKLPVKQRANGFLMQSFFIGVGATLANMLPWVLDHAGVNAVSSNGVPLSVLYSFRIGAGVFISAVLWTVFRTSEEPPRDMTSFIKHRDATRGVVSGAAEIALAVRTMPETMRRLFPVQFLTWFGLSCFWGLFTLSVARHVFHASNPSSPLFNRATEWAGVCMATYSVFCFVSAPIMPILANRIGRPQLHALSLVLGGVALVSVCFIRTPTLLLLPMFAFGVAWASILAMPYAILSVALPPERVGVYMGIFNFFIVLPQTIYSLTMSPVILYIFHDDPLYTLVLGGFCFLSAGLFALRVKEA